MRSSYSNISSVAELFHDYVFKDNVDYENLEHYLEGIGIEIYYAEISDVDGYLRINSDNGLPRIVVKANQYSPRQRFTMAHELGHLVLHHNFLPWEKWNQNKEKSKDEVLEVTMYRGGQYNLAESKKEVEANDFAGAFLMPIRKIQKIIQQFKESEGRNIRTSELKHLISDQFKVSVPAASMRLKRLLNE